MTPLIDRLDLVEQAERFAHDAYIGAQADRIAAQHAIANALTQSLGLPAAEDCSKSAWRKYDRAVAAAMSWRRQYLKRERGIMEH